VYENVHDGVIKQYNVVSVQSVDSTKLLWRWRIEWWCLRESNYTGRLKYTSSCGDRPRGPQSGVHSVGCNSETVVKNVGALTKLEPSFSCNWWHF